MKIRHAEVKSITLGLREPYTIAYETIDTAPVVFLRILTDAGLTGFGCAAPDLPVTRETAESVCRVFEEHIEPVITGADPFFLTGLIESLKTKIGGVPASSALAMLDMALYDLIGKAAGLPLYKILGSYRHCIETSMTIGILPVTDTLSKAKEFTAQGFKALKIKGGNNVEEDIERLIKLRETLGNEIDIRFDANQGYSLIDAATFAEGAKNLDIQFIEQPTPKNNPGLLEQVTGKTNIPVMADESIMDSSDALRLSGKKHVDLFNIKLMKCGGISEALHIDSIARAAGIKVMVGCMDEPALGISAALHFALARSNVIYADLDGHLDLIDDPSDGTVVLEEGKLYPLPHPGLGMKGGLTSIFE